MVSCAKIFKESERLTKELGDKFFQDLGNRIHNGMLEIERQRCERQERQQRAYARNWNLQVTI